MEDFNLEPRSKKTGYSQGAYQRAEDRLKKVKGFYWHLFWYLAVNIFITTGKVMRNIENGESYSDIIFDFGTWAIWIFWGIGIFSHWLGVFGRNLFFSKDWESRKIKEYMDRENEITNKYE